MKCPYRTTIIKRTLEYTETLDTEFKECLYGECPYYHPERKLNSSLTVAEYCAKVENEGKVQAK